MAYTPQTSYSYNMSAGFPGMLADIMRHYCRSALSGEASAEIPFGACLAQGASDNLAVLPASASAKLIGVLAHSHTYARDQVLGTTGLKPKATLNVLEKGVIWVEVEEAVAKEDRAYTRHTASGLLTQKGAWRKSADGVAEVHTITPTAANSTLYSLRVRFSSGEVYTFSIVSDGSATATEICNSFRTAMAADAAFAALVTGSGTATLILTGTTAGVTFTCESVGDGALADVVTTPGAPTAVAVNGARYLTTSEAGPGGILIAQLEVDFNIR